MDFEIRPISKDEEIVPQKGGAFTSRPLGEKGKKPSVKKERDKKKLGGIFMKIVERFGLGYLVLFFCLGVTAMGLGGAYLIASSNEPEFTRPDYVKPAQKNDRTNILFLGVAGAQEQGGYLTDSILVASISKKSGQVTLLSIPRDTWVKSSVGKRKINSVYSTARSRYDKERALTISKQTVESFLGHPIHHAAVVDFSIFEAFIDELGGLDIFVEKSINDPYYPGPNYSYQRFFIGSGQQTMDGATALKYARSRQTTSDFDRARRQQDILIALKEKAADLKLLTDFKKLGNIFGIYKDYVNTDIGVKDMVGLAKIASKVDRSDITHTVLNDQPGTKGGLLTQGSKQFYGGQFVLIPFDDDETQEFFDLKFSQIPPMNEGARIEVYNATKTPGIARQIASVMTEYGFEVTKVANYDEEVTLSPGNYIELLTKADVIETFDYLRIKHKAKERKVERKPGEDILADIRLIINEMPAKTPPPRPVYIAKPKVTPNANTSGTSSSVIEPKVITPAKATSKTPVSKPDAAKATPNKPNTRPSETDEAAANAQGIE